MQIKKGKGIYNGVTMYLVGLVVGGGFVLWRVLFGGVGVGVVLSWSVACVLLL